MWDCILLLLLAVVRSWAQYEGRVVCYYKSDNLYRAEGYKMQPQEIDPEICTHVIYYSAYLHPHDAIVPSDPHYDITKGGYKKIVKLKDINPNLKVMLSLRGEPEERDFWTLISAHKNVRSWFAGTVIEFLRAHRFDGLDIDWQVYSSKRNSHGYLMLLQELRYQIETDTAETNLPKLELSVLLPAQIQQLHRHFLVANVSLHVDFINVATMDYWSLDPYTVQHHAPLYKNLSEGSLSPLNVDESIKYYLFKCVPPNKIVLGVPTYGRTFRLSSDKYYGLGSQCKYPGEKGFATNSPGTLAYFEICTYINEECWTIGNTKATSLGPYAYHGFRWVGYDDVRIISIKAKYARDKELGGLMYWTIDQDDFRGYCQYKFPLIRAGKFTLSTGIVIQNVEQLEEEEERWKLENSKGYEYPKPSIQQPNGFDPSIISMKPSTQSSTTDNGLVFINDPTTSTPNVETASKTTLSTENPLETQEHFTSKEAITKEPEVTTFRYSTTDTSFSTASPSPTPTPSATSDSNSITEKPVTVMPNPSYVTASSTTSNQEASTSRLDVDERINAQSTTSQPPIMNLFNPNMVPQGNEDTSPNDAIMHLNRVLSTVNEIIANANQVNSASNNRTSIPNNVTIDPSVFQILQSLLNFRNTAQVTLNNPPSSSTPSNTTINIDSEISRTPISNDLKALPNNNAVAAILNKLMTMSSNNYTMPGSMLYDKNFLFSGRDIVNINLNVTVNNNFYQNN